LFSPEDEANREIERLAKAKADAAKAASAKQHAEIQETHQVIPGVGEFKSLGEFFTRCHKDFLYLRSDVLKILGITDTMEIGDLAETYLKIKAHWEIKNK